MADVADREERLEALYRLRATVSENIESDDRGGRAIVAAVDSLIEQYGGAPPSGRSNDGSAEG
jgi:hypothetical protein